MRPIALVIALALAASGCQFVTTFEGTDPDGAGPAPQEPFDLAQFEFGLFHRDDQQIAQTSWPADHDLVTGDGRDGATDCTGPGQTHTVTRGTSPTYNDEWFYVCDSVDGDTTKAHLMTAIGHTSSYSIGAFAPAQTFTDVTKINWDVNLTDLGNRQWTEVKIVPASLWQGIDYVPCGINDYVEACEGETGRQMSCADFDCVAASFQAQEQRINVNGVQTNFGYSWDNQYAPTAGDPALTSTMIRRKHFIEDNGDGTVTFGIERADGTFQELTTSGSFPTGEVHVVFADHNYTPNKSLVEGGGGPDANGDGVLDLWTWHWDNIGVT